MIVEQETNWDLAEKVLLRELTRVNRASGRHQLVQAATDAANAAIAARMRSLIQSGKTCGMESKLYAPSGLMDWKKLACFAHAVALLSESEQLDLVARLQNSDCLRLAFKYGSHFSGAVASCPAAVSDDPAYGSSAALDPASWDPTNPGAGDTYHPSQPAPPPGPPPSGLPHPTTLTGEACQSSVDAHMNAIEKGAICALLTNPAATRQMLEETARRLDHSGYPKAAELARKVLIERSGEGPPVSSPPVLPDVPGDVWSCSPLPGCLLDKWPAIVPKPCTPFPGCVCKLPFGPIVGCPEAPPAELPPGDRPPAGPPPAVKPVAAEEETEPWYSTTGGKLGLAAGGVTALALLVGLASR